MVTVNRLNNSRAASLPPLGNLKNAMSAEGTSLHCCLPLWVELGCHGDWLPRNSGRGNRHSPTCSPSGVWEEGVWQHEHQPKEKLNLEAAVHRRPAPTWERKREGPLVWAIRSPTWTGHATKTAWLAIEGLSLFPDMKVLRADWPSSLKLWWAEYQTSGPSLWAERPLHATLTIALGEDIPGRFAKICIRGRHSHLLL